MREAAAGDGRFGVAREVDELVKMEGFEPYMNVKLVIVEEDEALRVGYFELLPPSMMD